MSLMNLLSNMMNALSSSLLIPVMFFLTLLVFLSLVQLGEFLSEYTKGTGTGIIWNLTVKKSSVNFKIRIFGGI